MLVDEDTSRAEGGTTTTEVTVLLGAVVAGLEGEGGGELLGLELVEPVDLLVEPPAPELPEGLGDPDGFGPDDPVGGAPPFGGGRDGPVGDDPEGRADPEPDWDGEDMVELGTAGSGPGVMLELGRGVRSLGIAEVDVPSWGSEGEFSTGAFEVVGPVELSDRMEDSIDFVESTDEAADDS